MPGVLNLLGALLASQERYREAEPFLRAATKIPPASAATLYNYGLTLQNLGRPRDALAAFENALTRNPGSADAWFGRGSVLQESGKAEEAIACFDRALAINPNYHRALSNKGTALLHLRRCSESLLNFEACLRLNPNFAAAHLGKAAALDDLRQYGLALGSAETATSLAPDLAQAWETRANILYELGRLDEAIDTIGKAISLDPSRRRSRNSLIGLRLRACEWSHYQSDSAKLLEEIRAGVTVSPELCIIFPLSAAEQFAAAQTRASATAPARRSAARNPARPRHGRIRIAYLSGELRKHATAHLFAGVIERHDKERFEVTILNTEPRDRLAGTEAYRRRGRGVRRRRSGRRRSPGRVHQEERDRHSRQSRLRQQAAPRRRLSGAPRARAGQLSRVAGDRLSPQLRLFHRRPHRRSAGGGEVVRGEDRLSSRQLPAQQFEARGCETRDLATRGGPARRGVRLLLLQQQLQAQPRYVRRVVAHPPGLSRQRALAVAGQRGRGRQPEEGGGGPRRRSVSARLRQVGPGGRASGAQSAGRPLPRRLAVRRPHDGERRPVGGAPALTRVGETFASRVASSLLTAVGLPELIAPDREAYVATAIDLAHNPERLRTLKDKLDRNRATAPLFDTELYTRRLEAAFEAMHARRLADLPPDHIHIPA